MREGFLTSLDTALLFFRTCRFFKIESERERSALMRKIVARGKAQYVRDADAALGGRKVVIISKKRKNNVN